ncbi:MAG: hypothetical protein OQK04_07605, partial [Kangiellaceae bacterium]|nr:hypothetical protein [Kangiellaceae bacterium]
VAQGSQDKKPVHQKQAKTESTTNVSSKPQLKPKNQVSKTKVVPTNTPQKPSTKKTVAQLKEKPPIKTDESLFVSQLYDTLREDYILNVENYIENKARPVPSMTVRRKPKGEARLKVHLRPDTNQMVVLEIEVVEGQFEDSLRESLKASIKKLKRIPLAPDALASETFTVYVSLDFAKCKRSTSAWICF